MTSPTNPTQALSGLADAVLGGISDWERKQHRELVAESLRRENEALRLYTPQKFQEAFHASTCKKLLVQKGNQVGATLSGAVEVARAVTGCDPYKKYPEKDGVVCLLGWGEGHIGTVFYPKLFVKGAFDIIRDLTTKKWRPFKPWPQADGGDLERDDEKRPAPPLIPSRFIDGKPCWVKRGERIFSTIRLTTGWEIRAYNSAGDAGQAQGFQADLYWVDEDVATMGWIVEIAFRLMKRRGLLRWTALPHAKNDEMMRMIEDAQLQSGRAVPTTTVIRVTSYENKFVSNDALIEAVDAAKAQGDDVYRQRILGDLNLTSVLMYPTFSRGTHDVMGSLTADDDREILEQTGKTPSDWTAARILAAKMGEPPADWTRYVTIDPGATIIAIGFLAVPPPELGNQVFLYDECYISQPAVPAEAFGDAMQHKCQGNVIEACIMDMHGGRLRSIGSGEIPWHRYSAALRERNIRAQATEFAFRHACDDRRLREENFRSFLSINRGGQPRFMLVAGKCPSFVREMEKFKKKTVTHFGKQIPIDEGDRRVNTHAVEAIEGALALDLPYVKPKTFHVQSTIVDRWLAFRARLRAKRRANGFGDNEFSISLGPQGVSP